MTSSGVTEHFDSIATDYDKWKEKNAYYYTNLKKLCTSIIPPGKSVAEIGCATGDILATVQPAYGVGVDPSKEMLRLAKAKHPSLKFVQGKGETLHLGERFDYIIMCDLVEHLDDLMEALGRTRNLCHDKTRLVISHINPFWEPVLDVAEKLGMKMPEGPHNRMWLKDIMNLLELTGFRVTEIGHRLLVPKKVLFFSDAINWITSQIAIFRYLTFVQYIVAEPEPQPTPRKLSCSVIIPCLNEEGNIEECIKRVPQMGTMTEIIVVDDGSTDQTPEIVRKLQTQNPNIKLISYKPNHGKGYAVVQGFNAAKGDIVIILDADMTVTPEELTRFANPIIEGKADMVNGTRMVYPMEGQAMRQFNLLGNKIFSIIFTFLLGQRITDTLCGTKALLKKDYLKMDMKGYSWGDFDILINTAKLKLKLREVPVHYKARVAGESKMRAFKHGLQLLAMCFYGFFKLKINME